jgi:hypothetical protein
MALTNRALAFVSRWFDEATVRRTFEPLIADWQREWQEAPPGRRFGVSIRAWLAFACAVIVSGPRLVLTSAPPDVTRRIAVRMLTFMAVATLILMIPPVMETRNALMRGSSWMRPWYFLFALPMAITLAFPFAMAGAVDAIRRATTLPAHLERAVALKLGLLAMALMVIFTGWVLPAASQAQQLSVNPPGMSAPLVAIHQLTTFELVVDPARATVFAPGTLSAARSMSISRELNQRAMLTVLPIVLLWLRWRAHNGPRRRFGPSPMVVATVASIAVMLACGIAGPWLERERYMPMGSTYWLPIAVFAIWGILSGYGRRFLPEAPAQAH